MSITARIDGYQRKHGWVGFPLAVLYKFVDDQGGYLASLITYYGFLSLFPLVLIFVSVLGFVLQGSPHLQQEVLGSTLTQFPIVGHQLQSNIHDYTGSGTALGIGIVGSIYGGLGVAQAAQNAMNIVWAVPRHRRLNPLRSRARSLAVLSTLGVAILATTGLSAVSSGNHAFGLHLGLAGRGVALVAAVALNVGLFVAGYRILTTRAVSSSDVLRGAVAAGLAWQVLQSVGAYYIAHKLRGAKEVYGVFGVVLGLIAWIYLEALIVVICAEVNAVRCRRLWPRALLTPFTDNVELTDSDRDAYRSYAGAQTFKGFEAVRVSFDPERPAQVDRSTDASPRTSPRDRAGPS